MNTILFMRCIKASTSIFLSVSSYIIYQVFVENTFVKNHYTNIQIYETIGIIGNNLIHMPTIIMLFGLVFRPIAAYIADRYENKSIIKYSIIVSISTLLILGFMPKFSMIVVFICLALQASVIGVSTGPGSISSYNEGMKNGQNPNYSISILYVASFIGNFIGRLIARSFHIIYTDYIMNPVYQDWFIWRLPFLFTGLCISLAFYITYIMSCKKINQRSLQMNTSTDVTSHYVLLDKNQNNDLYNDNLYKNEYQYLAIYAKSQYKYLLYVGIIILCIFEVIVFNVIYFNIANDKAQFKTPGFPAFFWTLHQVVITLLLPFAGRFIDAVNKKCSSARNILAMFLYCILVIIFAIGFLYNLWPNVYLAIISVLIILILYATYMPYIIERTPPSQYNIVMFIKQFIIWIMGGLVYSINGMFAYWILIIFAILMLIFLAIFYFIEKTYQHYNVNINNDES